MDLNRKDIIRRIRFDPAGEWGPTNVAFHAAWRKVDPPIELVYNHTQTDKRLGGAAEVLMKIIEEGARAVMIDTGLEIEMWPRAVDFRVHVLNRVSMARKQGADGTGRRPLQEVSDFYFTEGQADQDLEALVPPGTLAHVRLPDAIKPKGSNFGDLRKYKWARAIRMEGRTVVWQDPWKPHVEFRQYIDYTIVRPPTGMNGLAFLGIPPPPLPRTAFTERHDSGVS